MKKKTSKAGSVYADCLTKVTEMMLSFADEKIGDDDILALYAGLVTLIATSHEEVMSKLKEFE